MEFVLSIIGVPQFSLKRALSPLVFFGRHISDHFIPHARNNYHPHILGHRALALFSGVLVGVKVLTLVTLAIGPVIPAFSSAITAENIITLTNESRQQFNLQSLTENKILDQAAQTKANDMLAKGYFAHNTPDGHTPWDFVAGAGYSYLMAGENLAVNFTEAENVETAWMNSPGHKANIINKNFEEIGIGIAQGTYQDHTAIFVVQMFGTPAAQKIAINDIPTKVQQTAVPVPAPATTQAETKTQVRGANAAINNPAPENTSALPVLSIQNANIELNGANIDITAQVTGEATKVIAYFGQQAIMLTPKDNGVWTGQVLSQSLAQSNTTVRLSAFDIQGQSAQYQLADFSPGTVENYNLSPSAPTSYVTLLNHSFDPKAFENRFYLFVVAGLLSSLILAIGIKRHIQHLSLIVNSSFVAIFAMLLFWAG